MWDEFTTGKKKDPKIEKKKSQPVIKTPLQNLAPDSSIDESDSEEEINESIKAEVVELPVQSPIKEQEEEASPFFRREEEGLVYYTPGVSSM
jgi:hypothetical protein